MKFISIENRKIVVDQRFYAYGMGFGLVLFAVHNRLQPLKEYAFLPVVGFAIILIFVALTLRDNKKIDLGPKYFWIPMAVISGSMIARLVVEQNEHTLAGALMGLVFFAIYLAAKQLGRNIFVVIAIFTVVEAVSSIAYGLMMPGVKAGGLVTSPPEHLLAGVNYDIATGVMVFGAMVSCFRKQWLIVSIALVGLFFTGAIEAVFACFVVGIVILARRDWSRKLLLPVGIIVAVIVGGLAFGVTQSLYGGAFAKLRQVQAFTMNDNGVTVTKIDPRRQDIWDEAELTTTRKGWEVQLDLIFNDRYTQYKQAIENIQPLGNGLEFTRYNFYTPHNVAIIIIDQIGVVAAVAWLFIMVAGLIKTKWKYAFTAVLALGFLDHFMWTQIALYWWVLVGVAVAVPNIKSDLIFKEVKADGFN